MNLQDIKDQVTEGLRQTWQKIQESSVYLLLEERYQLLSPPLQKIVLISVCVLVSFLVLLIPFSTLMTAHESVSEFEENKELSRSFLRVQREYQQGPRIPPILSSNRLESRIQSSLKSLGLLDEQITSVRTQPVDLKKWIRGGVEYDSLVVSVSQLNLTQITDVGYALQNLARSIKLLNMKIQAFPEDDHYYNVEYQLANYSIPIEPEPTPDNQQNKNNRKRRRRQQNSQRDN